MKKTKMFLISEFVFSDFKSSSSTTPIDTSIIRLHHETKSSSIDEKTSLITFDAASREYMLTQFAYYTFWTLILCMFTKLGALLMSELYHGHTYGQCWSRALFNGDQTLAYFEKNFHKLDGGLTKIWTLL